MALIVVPEMPEWLLAEAIKGSQPRATMPKFCRISSGVATHTAYGQSALDRELTILRNTQEGGRNHQLNRSAHALAQLGAGGQINVALARAALHDAALSIGLEAAEIERTLDSGWQAGFEKPRAALTNKVARSSATIISAPELWAMKFLPLQWALPGILPEGLTILAGKPKYGKSFLSLQMAVAVATGDDKLLGVTGISAGDVLVCALEDSPRRLKDRLARIYPFGGVPDRLHFATNWPRLDQGGIDELDSWCDCHPATRLIILDTWRAIKPTGSGRGSAYDEDATAAAPLLEFTKRRSGVAVLVVHHVRKQEADDVFDMISGTHGLTGIFDTLMVLARHGEGGKLAAQGRDMDGYEKGLERDRRTGGWIVKGDAVPLAKTGERQELLDLLAATSGPLTLAKLAAGVGKKPDAVRHLLKALVDEGSVRQPNHGNYVMASQFTQMAQFES